MRLGMLDVIMRFWTAFAQILLFQLLMLDIDLGRKFREMGSDPMWLPISILPQMRSRVDNDTLLSELNSIWDIH